MARPLDRQDDGDPAIRLMLNGLLRLKAAASMLLLRDESNADRLNACQTAQQACLDAARAASPLVHRIRMRLVPVPTVRLAHDVLTGAVTGLHGQVWNIELDVLNRWGIDEDDLVAMTRSAQKATGKARGVLLRQNPIHYPDSAALLVESVTRSLVEFAAIGRDWKRIKRTKQLMKQIDALVVLMANCLHGGSEEYRTSYSLSMASLGRIRHVH